MSQQQTLQGIIRFMVEVPPIMLAREDKLPTLVHDGDDEIRNAAELFQIVMTSSRPIYTRQKPAIFAGIGSPLVQTLAASRRADRQAISYL